VKIVNAHVHMIELQTMVQQGLALPGGISVLADLRSSLPLLLEDVLMGQMDEAGVCQSILYAVDAPIVYASNEYVAELVRRHSDRLMGFASVNPNRPDAPTVLEHAVRELGLRGLKLHPPLQDFVINDKAVYPLYKKACDLNIPVVFHVGTTPFGSLCRLSRANPLLVDDVAVDFPDLRILLTHLGTLWHNESFMVVEKNPNVFIDTAAYLYEIADILTANLLQRIGTDKVIFGTDYPMPYAGNVHRMRDFVDCICTLGLDERALHGIFYDNVQILLTGERPAQETISAAELAGALAHFASKASWKGGGGRDVAGPNQESPHPNAVPPHRPLP